MGSGHINIEIKNDMTKKLDRITLDSEEIEFCETRRAVSVRASGAKNVNKVVRAMGGNISKEVKNAVDMSTRSEENKDTDRIEETLKRMSCDKGWVAIEKCKIKEKTGRCERLLLKSNLDRRWF